MAKVIRLTESDIENLVKKIIKEEIVKVLIEEGTKAPINQGVEDGFFALTFINEKEAQDAKTYYSKLYVKTHPKEKNKLIMPLEGVARYLVNNLQNKSYNPQK